jgi:ketosteroid isomerase-like protein
MPHANVELAWQVSRAWNEGGVDALLEYLDADVEWLPPRESMEPGIYRGHRGVRDYVGRLGEVFGDRSAQPLEVIEVDDQRVILVVRILASSEHFAAGINADWAWLITVGESTRATRVETFTDKAQALAAAGLAQ